MDYSPPGFSVLGILQARLLEWVAILFSRGSSWTRDWTWVSCLAGRFFTIWTTRKAHFHSCIKMCWFLLHSKVIQLYIYIYILFHYDLLQDIKYNSLGYAVGSFCLSILYVLCRCCSATQLWVTLWDPMDCSTSGFPVLQYLSPGACSNSCPLSWWCYSTISFCMFWWILNGLYILFFQSMGLETLKTESIHFIKEAKLLVNQICPVTFWSFSTRMYDASGGAEMQDDCGSHWGELKSGHGSRSMRFLEMILLWWGDPACYLGPLGFQVLWYSHFGPAECTGLWQARRRVHTSGLSSSLETETLDFLPEFPVSYTFNIFLNNILVPYNWIRI